MIFINILRKILLSSMLLILLALCCAFTSPPIEKVLMQIYIDASNTERKLDSLSLGNKIQKQVSFIYFSYVDEYKEEIISKSQNINYNNTLFIGDSLTYGMNLTVNMENLGAKVDAAIGRHVNEALECAKHYQNYENIILTIGTNSYSMTNDRFYEQYKEIVEILKKNNQKANIYLNSMPPCQENKAEACGYYITNNKIDDKNNIISSIAKEMSVYYIDSNSYLKEINFETGDGLHMKSWTYDKWFQFIEDYMKNNA